ncbi:hypothetical protein [Companilactobacillus bobalius]|uniref:Uncharacterized protein n=2 Tax=Companilactobacillus bobalius TaxID=2801451 RepID=A0A202F395_9LACO|nr:hypothetical protein [Companilactobacillus bobalius]KAE9560128.1 hypothetical protein ATN92_07835 [Companilactobacillus bobalius]KRK84893.1 hypothetical protein FC78_GL001610 [Companilactobacillus bobalius DSM 19674]OVE94952.1 hypothetical protein LKACC16343_02803 [Companilactobacillus bobalius]GEO58710.1 hypothetical protein LBO01_18390 [Companilactobacillus paralimentarius]
MEDNIFPGSYENYDYDSVDSALPTTQALFFCTNLAEASYLPTQYTTDESNHITPEGWSQLLFLGHKFQPAYMVQGLAGNYQFELNFLTPNADIEDLSGYVGDGNALRDKLITFEGTDASGAYIRSDVGFETSQASEGIITWQPESIIAQAKGHFKSAHFIIESVDRDRAITTLDFDLQIIGNQNAMPHRFSVYISEFQRALLMIHDLIETGRKQLAYYVALYVAIVKKKIDDIQSQMADLKAQNQTNVQALSDLQNQIKASNLVTASNAQNLISQMITSGQVDVSQTMNTSIRSKLQNMNSEMGS